MKKTFKFIKNLLKTIILLPIINIIFLIILLIYKILQLLFTFKVQEILKNEILDLKIELLNKI